MSWIDGWTKVPAWVAVDSRLSDGERMTLVYVLSRVFAQSFSLSHAEVGRHRGINPDVARRHLRRLVALGYLSRTARSGRPGSYGRGVALDAAPACVLSHPGLQSPAPPFGLESPPRTSESAPPGRESPPPRTPESRDPGRQSPTSVDESRRSEKTRSDEARVVPIDPWLIVAKGYRRRYLAAHVGEIDDWSQHALHRSSFDAIAQAAAGASGVDIEEAIETALDGFFGNEWARAADYPPGALAKAFGKYFAPPMGDELRAELVEELEGLKGRIRYESTDTPQRQALIDRIQEIKARLGEAKASSRDRGPGLAPARPAGTLGAREVAHAHS